MGKQHNGRNVSVNAIIWELIFTTGQKWPQGAPLKWSGVFCAFDATANVASSSFSSQVWRIITPKMQPINSMSCNTCACELNVTVSGIYQRGESTAVRQWGAAGWTVLRGRITRLRFACMTHVLRTKSIFYKVTLWGFAILWPHKANVI